MRAATPAASPLARRMARAAGLELTALVGTGPNGRIVRRDVERGQAAAVAAPAAAVAVAAPEETVFALSRAQRTIAVRMVQAKATIPEFPTQIVVDMAPAVALRAELKALLGADAPSYNDMVVKACGLALRDHPRVNGRFTDTGFVVPAGVHVGIAVAGEGTLVVPVIRDADVRPLAGVAREARRLATAVREQRVTADDLADGTFTVSNLGMFGVTRFQPIVNPPQAAILGVGALREQPVVRDGAVVPGTTMELTLTADHRIVYGADAARFLDAVRKILEAPVRLLVADA